MEFIPEAGAHRPRRLRQSQAMRRLVAEHDLAPRHLVLPLFVKEGLTEPAPIGSMPGVVQHSMDSLRKAAVEAVAAGVGGLMLFGVPQERDELGTAGHSCSGVLNEALRAVADEVGDSTVVMSDTCLDEFTDHGHCGVLTAEGKVDNDATLARYCEVALAQARAGSAVLGLSGMMDGQVAAVRDALDDAEMYDTVILAYAAKYASAFYGPFREAVDSQLEGDRRTYQQDPANRRESLREIELDLEQGADIIMVKPAMSYLDIISDAAQLSDVPVWAYQVSGEYAMIEAAADRGWIQRQPAILESLMGMRRAGADTVLTYWAVEAAGWLR